MIYTKYKPVLIINRLFPYKFNSLHNPALRRNAPEKIPRIIHQIWLSKN
jgi:mannosyltransferase OCH1-like enzyme